MYPMYMAIWSFFMILVLSVFQLRRMGQVVAVMGVTTVTLILTHFLFVALSHSAGVALLPGFFNPVYYIEQGLVGWCALLVLPFGWLGPFIGLNLVRAWLKFRDV